MPPEARLRGLYAITPEIADTAQLLARVEAALQGGAAAIQYRAKTLSGPAMLEQARGIHAMALRHGVPLIVNDSLDLALAVGAEGLHLGREDVAMAQARARFPGLIGVSCYDDAERARAAAAAGANYVAVGSMFPSSTKPGAVHAPLERIEAARAASGGLPVVAIGGITPANAPAVIAAGAAMVAVISAVFDAPDVRAAARAFAALFVPPSSGASDVRPQSRPL